MNKVFVLDTSVVLYDATALSNFDEHDVVVPITVLEELDQFKKGSGVINLQARVFMRELDRLSEATDIRHWTPTAMGCPISSTGSRTTPSTPTSTWKRASARSWPTSPADSSDH